MPLKHLLDDEFCECPWLAELEAKRAQVDDLRAALTGFREAFANRGETTSLYEWNERLKAADAKAAHVLGAS